MLDDGKARLKRHDVLRKFVSLWHGDQERKYDAEPYVNHLERVADRCPGSCFEVAICHDLLEDTECTPDVLYGKLLEIGYGKGSARRIVVDVMEVSNDFESSSSDLDRRTRKDLEAERLSRTSGTVQTVKCADIEDNLTDIVQHDPGFARKYVPEKIRLLHRLDGADGDVWDSALQTALDALESS